MVQSEDIRDPTDNRSLGMLSEASSGSMGAKRSRSGSFHRPRPYLNHKVSAQSKLRNLKPNHPQRVNESNIYAIIHWLDKLFRDKKGSYVKFLARRGASAQQLLDLLQDVIKFGGLFVQMTC
jgi:hypothetical protein